MAKRTNQKRTGGAPRINIKKGDMVYVLWGALKRHAAKKDAKAEDTTGGKKRVGRVLLVDREKNMVVVEGFNVVRRHTKPTRINPQGGIIEKEAPIHRSRVALWCDELGGPTRVAYKFIDGPDGRKVKVRVCRKTGSEI